jgi:aerobic-type carbon monoxide dehydrogenase small subunit (CoxS/CutS family)
MSRQIVTLRVNGSDYEELAEPRRTLADFLRDDLELTGTHLGCEHGVCGACTVLVNGRLTRSCLMLAVQATGAEVTTIEGRERNGELHPLQEALRDSHSFQCGFCTPGFVMTTYALLEEGVQLDEDELREELSGNLCRCTGYQSIVDGVLLAMARAAASAGDAVGAPDAEEGTVA